MMQPYLIFDNLSTIKLFTFEEDDFTCAPMGQGPDNDIPFNGDTKSRSYDDGVDFTKAESQGGYNEADVSAEVETISEPAQVELTFTTEHESQEFDSGMEFNKVEESPVAYTVLSTIPAEMHL